LVNPVASDVPLNDRQWVATYGANIVYLTYQQLGALLVGTNSIFVVKSFDGGVTFPQVTEATTPEFGVQPDVQGNITVDQINGSVYTVFVAHPGNTVYIASSSNGGVSFSLKLVHQGPSGLSLGNVFPTIAVDRGSNLHVVYSDGTNVFLASSSDQGTTWTVPVRVNNGSNTKTALAPWIDAGDAGKVDITWWELLQPATSQARRSGTSGLHKHRTLSQGPRALQRIPLRRFFTQDRFASTVSHVHPGHEIWLSTDLSLSIETEWR